MFLNSQLKISRAKQQKGSAMVLAVFIMVIMTLLGAALVRMISSNAETIAFEVIGTRAYQAAQAGAQIKLGEMFPLLPNIGKCLAHDGDVKYDFSALNGLENCKASKVDCVEGPTVDTITYYTITSTGQCDIAGVFTSRTIKINARSLK